MTCSRLRRTDIVATDSCHAQYMSSLGWECARLHACMHASDADMHTHTQPHPSSSVTTPHPSSGGEQRHIGCGHSTSPSMQVSV
jgi:hypothetical protein